MESMHVTVGSRMHEITYPWGQIEKSAEDKKFLGYTCKSK